MLILFCVGLRGLNNPDIVATDVDPPPPGPTQSGLYSQRLQQSGSGAGSCRWMVARSRSVLQEQTVEVMEAVVWRCSSGGPWRSYGGARLEVRGGRLEVLAVRSVAVVWRRSLQVEGRPGAVQPNGCRTKD
ncbi:unnamed protein product [Arctogadus glacialis]